MTEIIQIHNGSIDGKPIKTVDAREVHSRLAVKKDFSDWIKIQIKRADLTESIDFAAVPLKGVGGKFDSIEYFLSIEAGKHIAMLSGTAKGKEIRQYFIECERKLIADATPFIPHSLSQALRLAADQAEQIELQQAQLAIAAPKAAFVDSYVESTGLKGFRQVAKLLKAKENQLREFLIDKKIMYRLGGEWHAHQPHLDAKRFDTKTGSSEASGHAFMQTKFTPKGIEWLAGLWAARHMEGGTS